jgi:hypothetical protein
MRGELGLGDGMRFSANSPLGSFLKNDQVPEFLLHDEIYVCVAFTVFQKDFLLWWFS